MFKRNRQHGSQKLEEIPDDQAQEVEMSPNPGEIKGKPSRADPGSLEARLPLMFRLKGTVISGIWWQILLVVIWTTGVVTLHRYWEPMQYKWEPILIQLMGVVCGLLLAFRSNSAYDRYWEGRKYWSTMTQGIRTLTRAIWINIKEENSADIVEKKSAINLLIAFTIATKHYLREEYDYDFEDLVSITNHIDWLHTPASTQPLEKSTEKLVTPDNVVVNVEGDHRNHQKTKGKKNKQKDSVKSNSSADAAKHYRFKAHDIATPTNIPLELSYYIGSYINSVRIRDKADSGTVGIMHSALTSLVECLTGFERILRTPIPLAYSVHLHQSIWIYILALPFQLVTKNEWWTILVVGITAFFLLGILAIGWEIENPFGYDDNDLPLDDFCKVLRREIEVIVSHKTMIPEEWVFKKSNRPFAPECNLNAVQLAEKPMNEVHEILTDRGIKISETNVLDGRQQVPAVTRRRRISGTSLSSQKSSKDRSETKKMLP